MENLKRKILLFGLGKQGSKYFDYFSSRGYSVFGITESGINANNLKTEETISFEQLKKEKTDFFSQFDMIIVAVYPYLNQTSVVKYLLKLEIRNKILIEKPVVNDFSLFDDLVTRDNFIFFIDELGMIKDFNLICSNEIGKIKIYLSRLEADFLEHSLGLFLLNDNFQKILEKIEFIEKRTLSDDEDELIYIIAFDGFKIICKRGDFYYNNTEILLKNTFSKSLEEVMRLFENKKQTSLYKKNFLLLEKFTSKFFK